VTHLSTILIIDDTKQDRDLLTGILIKAGHHVITAHDGLTGLSLCDEETPHIAFIDVMMPGLNGIEVLKQIKEEHQGVKVILCTGAGGGSIVDLAMRLGAEGYIVKPYDADRILMCLQRTLEVR
jgi:DNA-binding NtrC family response regulator